MKVKKGRYLHCKGGDYDVIGMAKHSETLEDMVIYEPLYKNELADRWARPLDMFVGKKEIDGKMVDRFKYMGELKHPRLEVHVASICFYKGKCLILKRAEDKKLYPGLWECGGGKVQPGEDFEQAVKREVLQEIGANVKIISTLGVYKIPVPEMEQKVIPGVKFICEIISFRKGKEPSISDEHEEWNYISPEETSDFDFIEGIADEISAAFKIYQLHA